MQLDTIGKNIRKYRLMKKFRQEDLAEKAGLTTNYIGMRTSPVRCTTEAFRKAPTAAGHRSGSSKGFCPPRACAPGTGSPEAPDAADRRA